MGMSLPSLREFQMKGKERGHSRKKESQRVVETAHPYSHTQDLKEFVTFPGATALSLQFSPQSFLSSRDSLRLFADAEGKVAFSASSMSFPSLPPSSSHSSLTITGVSFPRNRLILPGDSVLFHLQVSRPMSAYFSFFSISFSKKQITHTVYLSDSHVFIVISCS